MTDEQRNLLTLKEYSVILSNETNLLYLDKNFCCYMFERFSEAEVFAQKNKTDVSAQHQRTFSMKECCADFYSQGAKKIILMLRDGSQKTVDLTEEEAACAKFQYYNNDTNGRLSRLKQTKEKQHLLALKKSEFFTPVKIEARTLTCYPHLRYSYARFKEDARFFLLFSTIQEFDEWNLTQNNAWKPLAISMYKFGRIRASNPVFINPLSHKIILTDKLVRQCVQ